MFKIYTDGGSRGNPGPSGAGGVIISPNGNVIVEISEFLGIQTNNFAEYQALRLTLERAIEIKVKKVEVFTDSKLVVEQMNGRWKIKNESLKVINKIIKELIGSFEIITFTHIYRSFNTHADYLANKAMDKN